MEKEEGVGAYLKNYNLQTNKKAYFENISNSSVIL